MCISFLIATTLPSFSWALYTSPQPPEPTRLSLWKPLVASSRSANVSFFRGFSKVARLMLRASRILVSFHPVFAVIEYEGSPTRDAEEGEQQSNGHSPNEGWLFEMMRVSVLSENVSKSADWGIIPERLLFERSISPTVKLVKDCGIVPLRWLCDISRIARVFKPPRSGGIGPERSLCPRFRIKR
nr:hypothetical protein Iba_chr11fCG5210 [Ipomoea batatas]